MFKIVQAKRWTDKLIWIYLIFSFCLTFTYIYFSGKYYVDADMAGEMILADLLNKENRILSYTWYYSSELRIFYLQIFYRLTLLLFPNNWWLARVIGQGLWMITLLLSYFFLCGKRGLNLNNHGLLGAACLSSPFGIWYFWYGAYGGFYIPHMVLFLLSLGIIIRLMNNDTKNKLIYSFLLIILSFINGLGSIKGLMALYVPLIITSLIVTIKALHENDKLGKERRLFIYSLLALIAASLGYLLNVAYLSKGYSLFIVDHGRVWTKFDFKNFIDSIGQFLSLFGFQHPLYWDTKVNLFSINGLLGSFFIITVALLIFSVVVLIKKYKNLDFYSMMIITLFLLIILIQGSVFAFTSGNDIPNPSYWLTPLPMAFVVIELGINNFDFKYKYGYSLTIVILLTSIACTSIASFKTYFNNPLRSRVELKDVYNFLDENNYKQGYASLWNSNVLTEWSNGQIEMWTAYFYKDDCPSLFPYLQVNTHNKAPIGQFFILTSKDELKEGDLASLVSVSNVVYDDGNYIVLLYEDYDNLQNDLKEIN